MKKSLCLFACFILIALLSCGTAKKQEILVIHAGSLSVPFKEMSEAFMKKYPGVTVKNEAHGSRTCARQITELGSTAEVFGSADSEVIRSLLIPEYADYCIDFTTNEMIIMYSKEHGQKESITADNWYTVLLREDVEYGHSDPNADPCGYRARLCFQLAEYHYNVPGLNEKLIAGCPPKNIRPKEVDLLAMLESGELDYIFIYRSVAEQHKGGYLILPDRINLKNQAFKDFYARATIELTGKAPGETILQKGEPMVYGITVPKTARTPALGITYVAFVLSDEGQAIMAKNGQPELIPPAVDNKATLPRELQGFFQ
jgi:molybdate/tungstate transport system substrate-binding protein